MYAALNLIELTHFFIVLIIRISLQIICNWETQLQKYP